MSWHGQINRTIWEINRRSRRRPTRATVASCCARSSCSTSNGQGLHIPRDDRSFLFLHDGESPLVLLVHGASGTPAEFRELGNALYARGISDLLPALDAHHRSRRYGVVGRWVSQAQIAMEAVTTCSPTAFVCGLSLGGTVSLILHDKAALSGMILLAPALYPHLSLKTRFLQMTRVVTPTVFYHFAGWNGEVIKAMEYARKSSAPIDKPLLAHAGLR